MHGKQFRKHHHSQTGTENFESCQKKRRKPKSCEPVLRTPLHEMMNQIFGTSKLDRYFLNISRIFFFLHNLDVLYNRDFFFSRLSRLLQATAGWQTSIFRFSK